jgi:DNA polymerase III delta prime subunit
MPALLKVDAKRWLNWSNAKREQTILKRLNSLDNPYNHLKLAPLLFRTTQNRFHLSDDELRILLFMTITRTDYALASVFADCWETKQLLLFQDLSHLFSLSLARVSRIFSRNSILRKSGLIYEPRYYSGAFEIMEGLVASTLEQPDQPIDHLLRHLYHRSKHSDYAIEDFQHVKHHITAILDVMRQNSGSANVLIYGPPGTGKTELAKAINATLNRALYRLAPLTQDTDDHRHMQRIDAFYQLQSVVRQQQEATILFDEVEEIFASTDNGQTNYLKSFLNDLLESNPVPTLWVCNSVENFDHAFIRRFDYVLHLDYPNYDAKRTYLSKQALLPWLSRETLDQVAQHDTLSFGQLARAIRLIKSLTTGSHRDNDRQFISMLNEYLHAVGHPLLSKTCTNIIERHHMPDLFNSSVPINCMINVFNQCGFGRLLLQGEMGTGKSTAAQLIAESCQLKPFLITESKLIALSEFYGPTVLEFIFSEVDLTTEVLILDNFNQCLAPKPWHAGSLIDALSTQLKTLLATFKGFVIVTLEGHYSDYAHLFDVNAMFKALNPHQLGALESHTAGDGNALDRMEKAFNQTVVAFKNPERTLETETTLAEFRQNLRESRVREALTGQHTIRPKSIKDHLNIVPRSIMTDKE